MKKIRSFFYLVLALTLLFYGFPRFILGEITSISFGFALIWTTFALIVTGAHLYEWMGVAQEEIPHWDSKGRGSHKRQLLVRSRSGVSK